MSFLEPSARVPLIVRRPQDAGGHRVAEPVSLVDLAPTLLELAGLPADAIAGPGDGVSLVPALRRSETGGVAGVAPDHPVVSEYHAEGVQAPSAMIRHAGHKLIVSLQDPDLLYDLAADPLELTDRSGDPGAAPVLARLRAELARRLDLPDIGRRVRESQGERRLVGAALRQGRPTPWDHAPRLDAGIQHPQPRGHVRDPAAGAPGHRRARVIRGRANARSHTAAAVPKRSPPPRWRR